VIRKRNSLDGKREERTKTHSWRKKVNTHTAEKTARPNGGRWFLRGWNLTVQKIFPKKDTLVLRGGKKKIKNKNLTGVTRSAGFQRRPYKARKKHH